MKHSNSLVAVFATTVLTALGSTHADTTAGYYEPDSNWNEICAKPGALPICAIIYSDPSKPIDLAHMAQADMKSDFVAGTPDIDEAWKTLSAAKNEGSHTVKLPVKVPGIEGYYAEGSYWEHACMKPENFKVCTTIAVRNNRILVLDDFYSIGWNTNTVAEDIAKMSLKADLYSHHDLTKPATVDVTVWDLMAPKRTTTVVYDGIQVGIDELMSGSKGINWK